MSRAQRLASLFGVTDASAAAAGQIGEFINSIRVGANNVNAGGNNTYTDLASILLTPGDWDVSGLISINSNNSLNVSLGSGAISQFSGNTVTDHVLGTNRFDQSMASIANEQKNIAIPQYRLLTSINVTLYLKFLCTYASNTPNAWGRIDARRRR